MWTDRHTDRLSLGAPSSLPPLTLQSPLVTGTEVRVISPSDCLSAGWLIPTCLPAAFSVARAADAVPGNLDCPTLRDSQGRGGCSQGAGCLVIHTAESLSMVTVKGRLAFSALYCCFYILTPTPGQTLHRPWGPRRPRGHLAGRAGNPALDRGAAGVQRESRSPPREEEKTSPSGKSAVWSLGRAAPARATALGRVPSSFIQGTCAERAARGAAVITEKERQQPPQQRHPIPPAARGTKLEATSFLSLPYPKSRQ